METHRDALKEHEQSKPHTRCMEAWHTLKIGMATMKTVDWQHMDLIEKEKQYWREVLCRIISIICHLAERNMAFRGSTETLGDPSNGNFLGQVELMAKYDPVMREHLRRIARRDITSHYLSKDIQNELTVRIGGMILKSISEKVHSAKYYSVILDCTPDISHVEQMSVILRIVNCVSETEEGPASVSIAEHV